MRALDPAAPPPPACRTLPAGATLPVPWYQPEAAANAATLDAWCATTGPPVVALHPDHLVAADAAPEPFDELVVVSWNVHVGGADLPAMIASLRTGALTGGRPVTRFVLLLQEAYRAGPEVPRSGPPGMGYPRAMRPARPRRRSTSSGRPGGPGCRCSTCRRCATAPRRRPTRIAATPSCPPNRSPTSRPSSCRSNASGAWPSSARSQIRGAVGEAWPLRLASVHLENTASARRLRVLAPEPRRRQAAGLLAVLPPTLPLLVGGDFNTWFGYLDRTYKTMAAAVPDIGDHRSPAHLRAVPPARPRLLAPP